LGRPVPLFDARVEVAGPAFTALLGCTVSACRIIFLQIELFADFEPTLLLVLAKDDPRRTVRAE
jgi:hypothetical protein